MKRGLLFIVIGVVAALAVLYAIRYSGKGATIPVAGLLPRETIALLHVPDINKTRAQWHESDIYQLYLEPSVQEFLRKPLSKWQKGDAAAQTVKEIEQLDPKDAFVAITKIDNNNPSVVGGFRYRGSGADAERIIERWRTNLLTKNRAAQREKIQYEQHTIDTITVAPFMLATTFDGDWFLAANDLAELKAVIYRADHRETDQQSTLQADNNFRASLAHLPVSYSASFYLQPKVFAEKLAWLRSASGVNVSPDQRTVLEQIRSISGATRFDRGKIHDVFFVGMSKIEETKLTRSSLKLGTKDTLIYLATLLNLGQKLDALNQATGVTGSAAVAAGWQKAVQSLARSGVTAEEWKAAFGVELGALADWPSTAHWPWVFVSFPVQDQAKAAQVAEAITRVDEDSIWNKTEKDGVRYFSMISPASLFSISPTLALTNRVLIAGIDPISVEEAVKRSESENAELENSAAYGNAAKLVPAPTNFFAYVDLPLVYTRLDATLRPMLLLGAAFMPGINDHVDVTKLPAAEVVTKHLSPIVSSQRYDGDGYVAESTGPITLNQSGAGLIAASVWGSLAYQKAGKSVLGSLSAPAPGPQVTPAASPTAVPKSTQAPKSKRTP